MGNFIGHAGGFIILAAVIALFCAFLLESGVVKDRQRLIFNGKIAAMTAIIGIVYYFIIGYMVNILRGQTNIFDFNSIFSFKEIPSMLSAYEDMSAGGGTKGVFLPVFAGIVHGLGGLIFKQYGAIAVWLNFAAVCGGACCLHTMACDFFKKELSPVMLLYIFALPYAFLLFTPGCWGAAIGLAAIASYAFYKRKYILYGILAVLAVCINIYGMFVLIAPAVKFSGCSVYIKDFPKSAIANPYIRNGLLYAVFILSSVIMLRVIGG